MKWFEGSIPEAINEAKLKRQIFLVFIEGKDELSQKMGKTYEDETVVARISEAGCVSVRLEAGSESCQQFSQIYPVVIIPSSFFIGCNGIPLEVIAGSIEPQAFVDKISKVTQIHGQNNSTQSAKAEHNVEATSSVEDNTRNTPSGDPVAGGSSQDPLDDRVERAKQLILERNQQKMREEEEKEKNREVERRRIAREMQKAQQVREENEMKEWAKKRAQEKEEERLHKEKIQAQIAQDRAERAARFHKEKAEEDNLRRRKETEHLKEQQERAAAEAAARSHNARIQFRLPNGSSVTHQFPAGATLQEVSNFVVQTIQPGFSHFTLSTTFPRREFTSEHYTQTLRQLQLAPSAVILVVPSRSVVAPNSGSALMRVLWVILSPFLILWSLVSGFLFGSSGTPPDGDQASRPDQAEARSGSRYSEEQGARRRQGGGGGGGGAGPSGFYQRDGNVYRFSTQRSDDDEDNNTWNGNSTQQM